MTTRIRPLYVVKFILLFIKELLRSSARVAVYVLRSNPPIRPGVIAIPLDCKTDLEITLLANAISLTPGTLSLDVSDDRDKLYIHAMHVNDADMLRVHIKTGLERSLLEALR